MRTTMCEVITLEADGTARCPKCGKVHRPELTPNVGEEGGYFDEFCPGDAIFCECGVELEVAASCKHKNVWATTKEWVSRDVLRVGVRCECGKEGFVDVRVEFSAADFETSYEYGQFS